MRLHLFGASALVSAMEADLQGLPGPHIRHHDWTDPAFEADEPAYWPAQDGRDATAP